MKYRNIKYHRAFNAKNEIVNISNIDEGMRTQIFLSLGTKTPMTPCLGNIREHYFRHKRGFDFSAETELHEYAKQWIKYRFEKQESFPATFNIKYKCNAQNQCIFFDSSQKDRCEHNSMKTFDLKVYYDTAILEGEYKGYIADVLLTNSNYPDREPLFLEIYVTHKCGANKIDSKIRIIEIKVECEDDADSKLIESQDLIMSNKEQPKTQIKFYNFKTQKNRLTCESYAMKKYFPHRKNTNNFRLIKSRLYTNFFCTPDVVGDNPLKTYFDCLIPGMAFARNKYSAPLVYRRAYSNDNHFIVLLGYDIDKPIKPWVIYKIYYENGVYTHQYINAHFDFQSAFKDFIIAKGDTWMGGEVMSNFL